MHLIRKNHRTLLILGVVLALADASFAQRRGTLVTIAGGGDRRALGGKNTLGDLLQQEPVVTFGEAESRLDGHPHSSWYD